MCPTARRDPRMLVACGRSACWSWCCSARATCAHDPAQRGGRRADPRRPRRGGGRRRLIVARRGRGAPAGRLPAGGGRAGRRRGPPRGRRAAAGPTWRRSTCAAKLEDGRQVLVPLRGATRGAGGGAAAARPPRPASRSTSTPRRSSSSTSSTASARARPQKILDVPRPARRLRVGRRARRGPGDRREAPRRAARAGAGVTGAAWPPPAAHPRHLVLFALAAGLRARAGLAGGRDRRGRSSPRSSVAEGSGLAGAWRRSSAGAALADARLAALDAGVLGAACTAGAGRASAVVLEPVREHGAHASARVRLEGLGEQAVARLRVPRSCRPVTALTRAVARGGRGGRRCRGRVAPLGKFDAFQRRRGAHAAIEVDRMRRTGARRGGVAGALDAVRRRAEVGLARGLPAKEAALLRGMVLGQDERLSDGRADRLPALRARAPARGVAARTSCCWPCSCWRRGWSPAIGLRARLIVALGAGRASTCRSRAAGRRSSAPA